jgi:uncharacterized membrane protein YdjX (TVP38/TMEM64 family)
MLPGTFLYVYLGSLGSQAVSDGETSAGEWIARGVGLVATVVVTVYITHLARNAMRESVPLTKPGEPTESSTVASTRGVWLWGLFALVFLALAVIAQWQQEALRSAIESRLPLRE